MTEIPPDWLNELSQIRHRLAQGDNTTQDELNLICEEWKDRRELLRPNEKNELFDLVSASGKPSGLTAERWLCHLLALRHRCAHVLLRWTGSGLAMFLSSRFELGTSLILQVT